MINVDFFLDYLRTLPDSLIYVLLGLSAFVENVFPPIPGDTITAFGAFLVAIGRLNFIGVYISTTTGSLLGFMTLFWLGSYLGRRFFIEKDYNLFKADEIIKAEDWFRRYGYFIIALNRFLPGVRSVISIAGGFSRLRAKKVIIYALMSCATWNLVWIFMGYALGNRWETVKRDLSLLFTRYNLAMLLVFIVLLCFLLIKRYYGRK